MFLVVVSSEEPKGFIKAIRAFKNGQFSEVVTACNEEIERVEDDSDYKLEAILLRGTFSLLSGQFDKSLADFNQIINNKEADSKLRSNALTKRASLHMQTDQKEMSFKDFETAIEIDPNNPDIYHHRGQVYLLVEQLQDAVEDFSKASELAPNNPITYVHKLYSEYRQAVDEQDNTKLFTKVSAFIDLLESIFLFCNVFRSNNLAMPLSNIQIALKCTAFSHKFYRISSNISWPMITLTKP
jgi:mitochondrial import receptor subunit TOM70